MHAIPTVRLLVVEDDPSYRYLVQKAFSARSDEAHWELTLTKNGEEALRVLLGEGGEPPPDLILLDWNLPKVSGGEVLRWVKRHSRLRTIPVLVFSSSTSDEDIRAAYDEHANAYIMKPASIDALGGIVERIERFWASAVHLPRVVRLKQSNADS